MVVPNFLGTMPAKFGQSSDEQESSTIREAPPHLKMNSTPRLMGHDVKELKDVEGPSKNIPEDAQINNFETDELPGLFTPHHCKELDPKIRIMMTLKISHNYLKKTDLKLGNELTHSNFKRLQHPSFPSSAKPPTSGIAL